jgi:hypothetical protein
MSDSTPRHSPVADGRGDTISLHPSSVGSDMDKTKDLINTAPSTTIVRQDSTMMWSMQAVWTETTSWSPAWT